MPLRLKGHKYRAKPTVVDGVRFASQKEARRYQELKLLEMAGEIEDLTLQPEFILEAAKRVPGIWWRCPTRVGIYRADFQYREKGLVVVEDVKGVLTPVYRLKKKIVEACYGITIREV